MKPHVPKFQIVQRDDTQEWEQVVACEVLIPNVPNVYGDIYTEDAIVEFMIAFEQQGYGVDVNHNQLDVKDEAVEVVGSFIADETTPEFIKGSWVVVCHILDDDLWQQILDGDIAGYSFEATAAMTPVTIQNLANREVSGTTEPDPNDGHTHDFLVILDPLNKPLAGGTGFTNGHAHTITTHTVTDESNGHVHRYQVIQPEDDNDD